MPKLRSRLEGPLGYVLGAALFVLAFGFTSTQDWFRSHYPYLAYFVTSLGAAYLAGMGPGNLAAILAAIAIYFTYSPAGFFVAATQTPFTAASAVFLLLAVSNWLIGSMKTSRDKLAVERERYAALAENRDLLYRELQHRVSNNIQIVSGLLLVQSSAVRDAAARKALSEASGRIGLIGRIQRKLQGEPGAPAPFRVFAQELLTDAIAISGAPGVTLEVQGDDAPLPVDQATPVSLVMLECVNNALEHGFAAGQGGAIKVALEREGSEMTLTIADDGCGLPDGWDPDRSPSLGLKIMRAMAGQLEGSFTIGPGRPGCRCVLRFPVAPPS